MKDEAEKLAAVKAMFDAAAKRLEAAHEAIGVELREARMAAQMAQYAIDDLSPDPDQSS